MAPHRYDNLEFVTSPEDADARADEFFRQDPFKDDVKPALLNGADIYDYARVTGMIFPFEHHEESLKHASYGISFLGEAHHIDRKNNYRRVTIEKGTSFVLEKNSIAFVSIKTHLRLPTYIAMRFNLQIEHVHRGLLLGTGPMVDPGFNGRLLIPLHNLTAEDYRMRGGDGFIWAEFTKLSELRPEAVDRIPGKRLHKPRKKGVVTYFQESSSGQRPVRSSMPEIILKSERDAARAKRYAQLLTVAGVAGILALTLNFFSFVNDTKGQVTALHPELRGIQKDVAVNTSEAADLRRQLEALQARLAALEHAPGGTPSGTSRP